MKSDNGPAYFNSGKGSRRRQETKAQRESYRRNYERIFGAQHPFGKKGKEEDD